MDQLIADDAQLQYAEERNNFGGFQAGRNVRTVYARQLGKWSNLDIIQNDEDMENVVTRPSTDFQSRFNDLF